MPAEVEPEVERARRRSLEPMETPVDDMSASFMSRRSAGSGPAKKNSVMGNVARRTLGLTCLMVTVFLWTASNFLASSIFSDHTYDKPFFVVYINTSMFALSMIPISLRYIHQNGGLGQAQEKLRQAWKEKSLRPLSAEIYKAQAVDENDEDVTAGERLLVDDDDEEGGSSLEALDLASPPAPEKLSLRETAWLSLEFCMLWFFANYFASACLQYTSVGSVTILTSTSSVWTLVFCAWMKVDPFSVRKLIGVMASLAGIILISSVDLSGKDNDDNRGNFPHKTQQQIAIGDSMALVSAIVYGLYVTVMKVRVGDEDRVSMPLFFGLVGIINVLTLWPLFFILHFTGIETFEMPPTGKIWAIILLNSISSFISDMSWAYAMLLTTPLIVTVGLSLTIPLSLIGEMIQYQQFSSFLYWVGAGIVLLSFLFINHESHEDEDAKKPSAMDSDSQPMPV